VSESVVTTIEVHLDNGETVTMSFDPGVGWQQWGARQETLGRTMPIAEALASNEDLAEVLFGPEDEDEDEGTL